MSGHSKWAKIKHQKGANDAKRGALFTKLGRNITIAASEGGGDPDMNFTLRLAIDKARQANMPKDNIERAIKKGTGEIESGRLEKVSYEAYGNDGIAMIVDCNTDNTNRTMPEVKKIIEGAGGKFADPGSVSWQFEEKGLVVVSPKKKVKSEKFGADDEYEDMDIDDLMLELMEIDGVEDIKRDGDILEVVTEKSNFMDVNNKIEAREVKIDSSELIKVAKDEINVSTEDQEKVLKLIDELEEHDDVDSVWVNFAF